MIKRVLLALAIDVISILSWCALLRQDPEPVERGRGAPAAVFFAENISTAHCRDIARFPGPSLQYDEDTMRRLYAIRVLCLYRTCSPLRPGSVSLWKPPNNALRSSFSK